MDAQLRRALLECCVLATLQEGDSYGYRIVRAVSPHIPITESTLYPILRRLETAELLTVRSAEHNGRLRKYYRITEAGLSRIQAFKEEWREVMSIYSFVTKGDTEAHG